MINVKCVCDAYAKSKTEPRITFHNFPHARTIDNTHMPIAYLHIKNY